MGVEDPVTEVEQKAQVSDLDKDGLFTLNSYKAQIPRIKEGKTFRTSFAEKASAGAIARGIQLLTEKNIEDPVGGIEKMKEIFKQSPRGKRILKRVIAILGNGEATEEQSPAIEVAGETEIAV